MNNLKYTAETVLASKCAVTGQEIWTIQVSFWRPMLPELLTHRALSRNAGSSRARPVKRVMAGVWGDPSGPVHWGSNRAGMQAGPELEGFKLWAAKAVWKSAARWAVIHSWLLMKLGVHKQVANRPMEPYINVNVLITATDWDNFFDLRIHPDAQPEIQLLARLIKAEMEEYRKVVGLQVLSPGKWHLPYITFGEREADIRTRLKLSTARSARVSYEPFDGNASLAKELARHDSLVSSIPRHSSPAEHQAVCMGDDMRYANFTGFKQYRYFLEQGEGHLIG